MRIALERADRAVAPLREHVRPVAHEPPWPRPFVLLLEAAGRGIELDERASRPVGGVTAIQPRSASMSFDARPALDRRPMHGKRGGEAEQVEEVRHRPPERDLQRAIVERVNADGFIEAIGRGVERASASCGWR